MISTNSTYNTISAYGNYEWRIVNGSNTYGIDHLIDGTITSTLFETLSVGNTIASQLDLTMWDVTFDPSYPIVVQFRAISDTAQSAWYTKGTFYIDTIETSPYSENTKVTAFDAMLKSEVLYMPSGRWTATTDEIVLNRILADMGVTLASATRTLISGSPKTLTPSPNIGIDGTTDREMLAAIGSMRGGNWRINASNQLELVIASASPANTANIGDAVGEMDASPVETVTKAKVTVSNQEVYLAPPLPLLTTQALQEILTHNNAPIQVIASLYESYWNQLSGVSIDATAPIYGDQSLVNTLLTQFSGKSYYPYTATNAYVDPKYETGDGIIIKDVTSIIASQTINIDPLAASELEFKGKATIDSLYPYVSKRVRNTNYKISENAKGIAQNASDIAQNAADIANLESEIGLIPSEIQRATELITGGFGGYIKYTYLSDGTPSELLIMDAAEEENATNIIRLNRNGLGFSTDGGATYANAWTIDGNLNADYIRTGTLSADRIAANSIGVGKLTGSISNNNWVIDLDAGTLTIGNISASNINTGTLNADLIKAGTISDVAGKNSWNLTTGEFITTFGEVGGWTIDGIMGLTYTENGEHAHIRTSEISIATTQFNNTFSAFFTPHELRFYGKYPSLGHTDEMPIGAIWGSAETYYSSPDTKLCLNLGIDASLRSISIWDTGVVEFRQPVVVSNGISGSVTVTGNVTISGTGGNVLLMH